MNNNISDKNALTDNNIINNSKNTNLKKSNNGNLSDQLIFFKEDVLKDIRQLESKIFLKYDIQHNINSNKINKIESILEQINQRIAFLSSSINVDSNMKETIERISEWNTKIEETLLLQDVRIKNLHTKLTESNDKFDQILSETVIYPLIIGPKAKFKTFHELLDFTIFNINTLLMNKEKMSIDLKEYKYKTDSMLSNFQIKLDYLTKNANAFTSSSIRTSEKKMEQIIYSHEDELKDFKTEFNNFKNEFNSFTSIQEDKILNIIEKSKKFENLGKNDEILKKIESLSKKIENLKDVNGNKKSQNEKKGNYNNHNYINSHENVHNINTRRSHANDKKINNNSHIKNATSILKEYINGNIRESDIYQRRRSVSYLGYNDIQKIKEKIDIKPKQSSFKKNNENRKSNDNKNESVKNSNKKSDSSSESESESEEDKSESSIVMKENDINIIKKDKQNNEKDVDNNSVTKYIALSRQLNNTRNNPLCNNNSISNNSDIENYKKKSIKDMKTNDNFTNINYVLIDNIPFSNKNFDDNRSKIILKNLEGNKNKDSNNLSSFEKSKKYEKIKDVKTIITVIKNESREKLIPILPLNKINDKIPNKTINENYKNNTIKINDKLSNNKIINELITKNENKSSETNNINFIMNNNNTINCNSRNKIIKLESDSNNNNQKFSKTKVDFSKIKLQNSKTSSNKLIKQRSYIKLNLNMPNLNQNIGVKKLNKATSAEKLTLKKTINNANKINISFKPYEENNKEKEEQKMKRIFSQMKDFLPSDEKALIKERFVKYGYDKEKIFKKEQKQKYDNLRLPKA